MRAMLLALGLALAGCYLDHSPATPAPPRPIDHQDGLFFDACGPADGGAYEIEFFATLPDLCVLPFGAYAVAIAVGATAPGTYAIGSTAAAVRCPSGSTCHQAVGGQVVLETVMIDEQLSGWFTIQFADGSTEEATFTATWCPLGGTLICG